MNQNPPSSEQDEARLLSLVLAESAANGAVAAARQISVLVGLNFLAAYLMTEVNPPVAAPLFIFGPLLVTHLLWARRTLGLWAAKASVNKLPLWERHRVHLLLQSVEAALAAKGK